METRAQELYRRFRPPGSAGRVREPAVLTNKINLRMDDDQWGRLMAEAESRGVHHAELVRTFIEWGLSTCEGEL